MTAKKAAASKKKPANPNLKKGNPPDPNKLTAKEAAFVEEYLVDLNTTAAYIRAGYSKKAAHAGASRLFKRPRVAKAIAKAMADRSERTKIDADWLLTRLAMEATADMADLYSVNGTLLPVTEWPLIWRQGLIVGVETFEEMDDGVKIGETVKLKQSDRIKRLEMIGKHINVMAFAEKHLHGFDESAADILAKARKRAAEK